MTPELHHPELHHLLPIDQIGPRGLDRVIEAAPEECAAIAARLGIPGVISLVCRFHLTALAGGLVLAQGHLTARLVRDCVVTLEPFETGMEQAFQVRFVPAEALPEEDVGAEEEDDEVPYEGASIDLGEAAVEQLALDMDPYPRKPGAEMPTDGLDAPDSPFAALARRKTPQ